METKVNKQLLQEFLDGKIAVNIRTQEEHNEFLKYLEDNTDLLWFTGSKPTQFSLCYKWNGYERKINIGVKYNKLKYSASGYFESENIKVIPYTDLIKPDLRDLLQVGYKVIFNDKAIGVLDIEWLSGINIVHDKNLKSCLHKDGDINAIYKPKYNGLKPMEWVKVWERKEEPLYTLELPDCYYAKRYLEFCMEDTTKYRPIGKGKLTRKRKVDIDSLGYQSETFKSIFTQKELDNLPNQDFIKSLDKKKVENSNEH